MKREKYVRKHASKLSGYKDDIVTMRIDGWPYYAIAQRLTEECGVEVTKSGVAKFCERENIIKHVGIVEKTASRKVVVAEPPQSESAPPKEAPEAPVVPAKSKAEREMPEEEPRGARVETEPEDIFDDALETLKTKKGSFTSM